MKRIAVALTLFAGLAACGPDCDRFCKHWVGDCAVALKIPTPNLEQCIASCNQVGGDYAAFINCAIDKTCPDLAAGACQIPNTPPGYTVPATALFQ